MEEALCGLGQLYAFSLNKTRSRSLIDVANVAARERGDFCAIAH